MPTVLDSLNAALHQALAQDHRVVVLGEDILDPYGGAFKVTRGLSQAFPHQVFTTPISEAAITGLAIGMALRGLRPVVEIMFGDFLTLAADQIINHAAKFRWMYNGNKAPDERVRLPVVIRTPMGGRRGYGPTHSQTLEKHFLGVPGLVVLAPTVFGDPGNLLQQAIFNSEDPLLFVENKLLYLLPLQIAEQEGDLEIRCLESPLSSEARSLVAPTYLVTVRGAPPPYLTVTAYGYMAELARQAQLRLAYEHEVFVELVVPTSLTPFPCEPLLASLERTGRLLAVEEGTRHLGWGAEVLARSVEALGGHLRHARRLAARDLPVPASRPLEEAVLPSVEDIICACLELARSG